MNAVGMPSSVIRNNSFAPFYAYSRHGRIIHGHVDVVKP
jgi:hypothetical protein